MKFDKAMIETAKIWAQQSYCNRKKVGAVLSSQDGRILACGYNGTISGLKNECEDTFYKCSHCGYKTKNIKELVENFPSYETKLPSGIKVPINAKIILKCVNCSGVLVEMYSNYDYMWKIMESTIQYENILVTNEFTLHAEQNVISFCAKNGIATKDTILYVTLSPCKTCSKLIAQSGIKRVVYLEEYRDKSGIEFLKKVGVFVEKYNLE